MSQWQHEIDRFVAASWIAQRPRDGRAPPVAGREARLEWEPLATPVVGTASAWNGRGVADGAQVVVTRDAQYALHGLVLCKRMPPWAIEADGNGALGSFEEFDVLEVVSESRQRYAIHCMVSRRGQEFDASGGHARVELDVAEVHAIDDEARVAAYEFDWLISGPSELPLVRSTIRTYSDTFDRVRGGADDTPSQTFARTPVIDQRRRNTARDHVLLRLARGPVRVGLVPRDYAAKELRAVSIERAAAQGEPDWDEERDALVEGIGLLYGRHPLYVGTTVLDAEGALVRSSANAPWGRDVLATVAMHDQPAVPLDRHGGQAVESTVGDILRAYGAARDEFALRDVMWLLWVGMRMPAAVNLPAYAATLEALRTAWFRSTRSTSRGRHMPEADFERTFSEALAAARRAAVGVPHGEAIVRRMGGAFQMSSSERFQVFFSEIGLPIGPREAEIIRSRNAPAHGNIRTDDMQKVILLGEGYRTLINRCILKLLGYGGAYIDYSTIGHPVRPIDEPMGHGVV